MSVLAPVIQPLSLEIKEQRAVYGAQLGVLADIYQEETNITIWRRELSEEVSNAAGLILDAKPSLRLSASVCADNAYELLNRALGTEKQFAPLAADITKLVDMFCYLFDLDSVGLRLTSLKHVMCPRFHVDNVPCRLVSTYHGDATEWLPHDRVDRSKLGPGNKGIPDDQSGLFSKASDIQLLRRGEIALLKGEGWLGNEGAGLVHRSPQLKNDTRRLLLTLDFMS